MGRTTRPERRRRTRSVFARAVQLILVVAVTLQLSGVMHAALDAWRLSPSEIAAHFEDADDDGDCPPGCPTCHHANGGIAAPPPFVTDRIAPAAVMSMSGRPSPRAAPLAPELDPVFRPPRVAPHVHVA